MSRAGHLFLGLVALTGATAAEAQDQTIRPKPPDFGTIEAPGEVRRLIQPFGEWTLICDENLKRKQKVCNVSQSFVDGAGAMVFSWSLAATKGGNPVLILRARNETAPDSRTIRLELPGLAKPQEVRLTACDTAICVGYQDVGPVLGPKLREGGQATITVTVGGKPVRIGSDLKNLNTALAALK